MKTCIYCDENREAKHFISDCCGRGMCDVCYDSDRGSDEQFDLNFSDPEEEEGIKIKEEYKNGGFLCFDCEHIWLKK